MVASAGADLFEVPFIQNLMNSVEGLKNMLK
jgi:hypothetical protein